MEPNEVQRRLTTILSADVKGYSRLMAEDEAGTIRALTACREIIRAHIETQGGRVVDSPGDNLLAEFPSAIGAVQSAVAIQRELKARNAALPEGRRMEFRIGVNLGDVVVEGGRLYGDGVNIAARLEALAEGGGICISGDVHRQVRNKLGLGFEDMGEQRMKNIAEPVRSYRVTMDPAARGRAPAARRPGRRLALGAAALALAAGAAVWGFYLRAPVPRVEVASEARMAFPLPAKPSVAVLAFENLSGDPGQEFLADGIAENIISALSKVRDLFVIARQATFAYKGKPVKVQRVAEELGVRYVLTGSFQRAGDRARITAQLVDALTGRQLWSERYDQEVKDIFDLQDAITLSVVTSLQVRLTEGEQALVWRRSTNSLAAWEHHWRALGLLFEFTKEKNLQARELWEKAVGLDPAFALAWTYLAWTYWQDARLGWSPSPSRSFAKAAELAEKARALDPSLPDTYSLLALIRLVAREHEEAVAMARRAVDLGPNLSFGVARLGYVLVFAGRPEEAVGQIRRAMRLMPNHPTWYLFALAEAYRLSGRYTEMIAVSQKLVELTPAQIDSRMQLAYAHVQLGQEGKARAHVAEILKVHPGYSASLAKPGWAKAWPFKDRREIDRIFDALRRAGLPE